ncbi:hypothetical protein [Nocardiopsis sp. JB363]|uniref:hypothetical protein n=1 Tax=Nocardiopsis sp. JB363 TaxID=1434837 RepID=UPI00117DD28A|nr:hypothetical protein [Nocardiopsis sp. JB363]
MDANTSGLLAQVVPVLIVAVLVEAKYTLLESRERKDLALDVEKTEKRIHARAIQIKNLIKKNRRYSFFYRQKSLALRKIEQEADSLSEASGRIKDLRKRMSKLDVPEIMSAFLIFSILAILIILEMLLLGNSAGIVSLPSQFAKFSITLVSTIFLVAIFLPFSKVLYLVGREYMEIGRIGKNVITVLCWILFLGFIGTISFISLIIFS